MKRILFLLFTFLSFNLFAQTEAQNEFRTSTGILKTWLGSDFHKSTVLLGGKVTTIYRLRNSDTYKTISAVNDSLRIQTWKVDTSNNTFITAPGDDVYIDNVINKNEIVTTLSNTLSTGHNIGTYTNESGTAVNLKESIVSISKVPWIGYRLKKEDGTYDTITFNQTKYIALRDTSNCTAWNYGTLAIQTDAATADSLYSIVINGVTYPINYPIDDGGTGDIPPATASALETLISGIISSAGYSAVFTVTSPTIFTQFDHILTAGNSPMSITYNYSLGGLNATSTVTSYPIACDFTPRNFTAADNAYAQSNCPFLTFAYTTGALDTLRAWDCKSNGWQIISSESPDVITSIQNTITGHKIADYTNESNTTTNINESVIGVVNNADGSATITKEDGSTTTIPTQNASNNLRKLTDGTIVRGSDDPANAKGSQFTSSIYNHMNGFDDIWVGANGASQPTLNLQNNGDIWSGLLPSSSTNGITHLFFRKSTGSLSIGYRDMSDVLGLGGHGAFQAGRNTIASDWSLATGADTRATGWSSVSIGGVRGIASGGGSGNVCTEDGIASGLYSFVAGGSSPKATNSYAVQLGGSNGCLTNGYAASGIGGDANITSGVYSGSNGGRLIVITSNGYSSASAGGQYKSLDSENLGSVGGYNITMSNSNGSGQVGGEDLIFNGYLTGTLGGKGLNTNAYAASYVGFNNVIDATESKTSLGTNGNEAFVVGGGYLTGSKHNSMTVLGGEGGTQINSYWQGTPMTISQKTPKAALDVVSVTNGFLAPRMTEAELNTFLATLNLTTDVTGGADGNAYCKKGMMIECTDCTSLDGSTQGVTVKCYPNAAVTAWIAKKLW